MTKRFKYLILASSALLTACYPDYVGDYVTVAAGFANQSDVRTVVVGEKMEFSTGVALGGVIENNEDRRVAFSMDYSLVNDALLASMKTHRFTYIQDLMKDMTGLKPLPASMYTLQTDGRPGVAVIKAGSHLGKIIVKIDPEAFLADEANLKPQYILPLRLDSAQGCGLIEGLETTCIGVHYEALLFGNWWHGGTASVKNTSGETVETVDYAMEIPQSDSKVWTLSTDGPHSMLSNAVGAELSSSIPQMRLILNEDNTISLASVSGATYQIEQDGECFFNGADRIQDREITLNYKYVKNGLTYHCSDVLKFRNRVRDGVNEWQDENPDKY